MNENIDLTKILKDCPEGTKFYSTIFGGVEFMNIVRMGSYLISFKTKDECVFCVDLEGKYMSAYNGECTLFPSREQRDWSKFTAPWHKKEKASLQSNERAWLYLVSDVLTWKDGIGQYLDDPRVQEIAKRLCNKYAKKLYTPSVLSNSLNTGKNEQKSADKFDPKTLQPFDRVLVKLSNDDVWEADFFSHYDPLEKGMKYVCVANFAVFCIPYNDETKHLVGTTEEAPEYYRYWED